MIGLVVPITTTKMMQDANFDATDEVDINIHATEIVGLEPCIGHILKKNGCQSRTDVMSELVELDTDILQEGRTLLFNNARGYYEEQLSQHGVENVVKIEPKSRRTKETISRDLIDLYLYIMGVREDFPRHSIKDVKVFCEVPTLMDDGTPEEQERDENVAEDGHENSAERGDGHNTEGRNEEEQTEGNQDGNTSVESIQIDESGSENGESDGVRTQREAAPEVLLHNEDKPEDEVDDRSDSEVCKKECCQDMRKELQRLWDYVLNIETISVDRMTSHESRLNVHLQKCNCEQRNEKETSKENSYEDQSKSPKITPAKKDPPMKGDKGPATARMSEYQNTPDASSSRQPRKEKRKIGIFPVKKAATNPKENEETSSKQKEMNDDNSNEDKPNDESPAEAHEPEDHDKTDSPAKEPYAKDSKHYQVDGDKRFPRKFSKRSASVASKEQTRGEQRPRRRILQPAGRQNSRTVELYLPNLSKHPDDSLKDMAEIVRECGRKGGVHVITSRIVQNRYNDNVVGCRITVPERQQDDALGNRVWPYGIKCRRWTSQKQKPDRNVRNHQSGDPKYFGSAYYTRTWERSKGYWTEREDFSNEDENEELEGESREKYYYYDEDQGYEGCEYEDWEDRYDADGNDIGYRQ